ncbi:hypothetical protein [Spirosoma endbachense]|uniref:Uncharacterized protein n=1 Tax=Spirosoma endbachense TaxID=2666025 RepID=A0A6P1W4F4_9BACT|nr:hypothetical protein [Spirosoma endbachense]QHV99202.1 hypothetical protein GJR95_31185 [Spirosoma endbachense]
MKKISTLFKKDPSDLSRVIAEVDPENAWALTSGMAYRKFDGTACAIIDGELYKRYDAKHGKPAPIGGIPCQDPDPITGHWPHWVRCDPNDPADQYFWEGWLNLGDGNRHYGTYELCGPKVKRNPEGFTTHFLIPHEAWPLVLTYSQRTFEFIQAFLFVLQVEGIVFHHPDGRMCKIRKTDFGFKREAAAL